MASRSKNAEQAGGPCADVATPRNGKATPVEAPSAGEESDPLASDHEPEDIVAAKPGGTGVREKLFGASVDDIFAERSRRRRRGKRRRIQSGRGIDSRKRVKSGLPPHLTNLMGRANLAYMNKDFKEAEKILVNVIREAPKAVGPYHTLGLISEEMGDAERALSYYMFAAHLQSSDRDQWKRNAAMSYELGNLEQAAYCLTRAIKGTFGQDTELLHARAKIFREAKEYRKAADSYRKILRVDPANTQVSLDLAEMYSTTGFPKRSVVVLQQALDTLDKKSTEEKDDKLVSCVLEALIDMHVKNKKYMEASVLLQRMDIQAQSIGEPLSFKHKMLVAICRHRLGSPELASDMFHQILTSRSLLVRHKDLLWEVAEAYHDGGAHEEAITTYNILQGFEEFKHRPALYLNRSLSYKLSGNEEREKADLEHILEFAPNHTEASLKLMRIRGRGEQRERALPGKAVRLRQISSPKRAKGSPVSKAPRTAARFPRPRAPRAETTTLDREARKILSSANAAYERGNHADFLNTIGPLFESALQLTPHSLRYEDVQNDEIDDVDATGEEVEGSTENEVDRRIEALELLDETGLPSVDFLSKKSGSEDGSLAASMSERFNRAQLGATILRSLDPHGFLQLTWRIYDAMALQGKREDAHEVISVLVSVARSRLEISTSRLYQIRLLYLATCLAGGKYAEAVEECRTCLTSRPEDSRLWYLLQYAENRLIQDLRGKALYPAAARQTPTMRFIDRLLRRGEECVPVIFASANRLAARNSHQHAIQKYLMAYKLKKESPLVCLCIGAQLLFVSLSRRTKNRNKSVFQAFAFLEEYRRLRTSQAPCKILEVEYNIGRAAQQLGLMHIASEMYHRVLQGREDIDLPQNLNIRREAAFNLSLIYKNSGSNDLAAMLVKEHLVF